MLAATVGTGIQNLCAQDEPTWRERKRYNKAINPGQHPQAGEGFKKASQPLFCHLFDYSIDSRVLSCCQKSVCHLWSNQSLLK